MPKKVCFKDSVKLSQRAYNKIMMWSMSLNEVGFVMAGRNGRIVDVYRLRNYSSDPKDWILISPREKHETIRIIESRGQTVIGLGHSHPRKCHSHFLSKSDIKYFPKNELHLLVLPCLGEFRGFILERTSRPSSLRRIRVDIS